MATSSPSPNSSPSVTSPTSPPPSPPQPPATTNATPPTTNGTSPTINATSPISPPSTNVTSPQSPPTRPVSPPPAALTPPPTFSPPPPPTQLSANPPLTSPPPPATPSLSPPPPASPNPPSSPPPSSSSPPPPPSSSSPPPPSSSSPPPSSSSPPPPSSSSPPPPAAERPTTSPPPPKNPSPTPPVAASPPPLVNSPPPPSDSPPESPSPPPSTTPTPPKISPPPGTPEIPISPPPSQPPPSTTFSPPPPLRAQFSPPPSGSPTTNSTSGNPPTNTTSGNAPDISSSSGSNGGLSTGGVVAIVVVLGLVLFGVIGMAVCFVKRRKRKSSRSNGGYILPTSRTSSPQSDSGLLKGETSASRFVSTSGSELVSSPSKRGILGNSRALFTFEELVQATNGFSEENLLGEGGFGSVYKGYLPDGTEVAVKQLKIGGGQGEREFKAEVEIISRIHHRHLVSLAGYCIWETKRLLVYEYVPNNNLHFHLHEEGRPVMEWAMRVKIAAGAARGIAYLHEDCHPRVIHRDIKSSNILLDKNFEARVSDFGLAKLAVDANTHISTRVVGTFGYMAPEYASSGKLTEKSDVFSFGVVLLELITGRKPVDTSQPLGDESLVEWARPLLSQALETEEFEALADPKLDKNYVGSEMLQMVEVAAACVRHSAVKRPRMGQVVRAFESMVASDITNGVPVGDSEIYNTTPQSSEIRWFRKMAFGNQEFTTDFFTHNSGLNRSRSFADEV